MQRRRLMAMLGGGVLVTLVAAAMPTRGGWVIVTMHEWPEALVAGQPTSLSFSMRQHGQQLLAGREPRLELRTVGLFGRRSTIAAQRTREPGVYRATFTPDEAGDLRLTVDTDFNGWEAPMPTVAVRAADDPMSRIATSGHERGQNLFLAKGCAGCHSKTDDDAFADVRVVPAGPDLTGRRFPAGWVERKILDPAALRATGANPNATMPRLEVREDEAAAIAAYVNRQIVAARR